MPPGPSRLAVATAVGAAHIGLGVYLFSSAPSETSGGAPVINLSLEPVASFDGDGGSQNDAASTAEAAETDAGEEIAWSAPLRMELKLRVATSSPPTAVDWVPAIEISAPMSSNQPPMNAQPRRASVEDAAGPSRPTSDSGRDSRAGRTGGGGGRIMGAAAAPREDLYGAAVVAWIERHKRHPGGRASGVVHVRFVLDRQGRLRASRIVHGSGAPALDQVAMDQLHAMQPFPKPAPGASWSRRDFDVAIDYRLP